MVEYTLVLSVVVYFRVHTCTEVYTQGGKYTSYTCCDSRTHQSTLYFVKLECVMSRVKDIVNRGDT